VLALDDRHGVEGCAGCKPRRSARRRALMCDSAGSRIIYFEVQVDTDGTVLDVGYICVLTCCRSAAKSLTRLNRGEVTLCDTHVFGGARK
jgi:hypothetical protein